MTSRSTRESGRTARTDPRRVGSAQVGSPQVLAGSCAGVAARTNLQHHGDAPVRFILRRDIGHRHGVAVTGYFANLARRNAVLDELAAGGAGAVRGDFPVAVIGA